MGKRDGLIRAYIGALDVRVILIAASPDGKQSRPVLDEPPRVIDRVAAPLDVFWFTKASHAEIVHDHYLENCEAEGLIGSDGWLKRSPRECRDDVIDVAAMVGAPWQTTIQILDTALAAVVEIENRVEAMRTSGGLAQVNAEFKSYRVRMQALGRGAISYSAFLSRFTGGMVALVAAKATLAGQTQFGDLRALARASLNDPNPNQ